MSTLCFDVETTRKPIYQPYQKEARYVVCGLLIDGIYRGLYSDDHSGHVVHWIFHRASLVVTFNGQFDINWIRREFGIELFDKQVWDVQIADFIISSQENKYPSLNDVCGRNGLPGKLDVVKTEYWDKGIDTPDIPRPILSEYLEQDVMLTYQCYLKQKQSDKALIIRQAGWDLLCLAEMTWNGMKYDFEGSINRACGFRYEIEGYERALSEITEGSINWASPRQVAAVLYGGIIETPRREEFTFHYKDGRIATKTRWRTQSIEYPRLVEPIQHRGEDVRSVDEGVLRKLKPVGRAAKILSIMAKRSKLTKLVGTYLCGIPARYFQSGWQSDLIHGSLNQCAVVTGRLSADKPNLQNIPPEGKEFFVTRYANQL